MTPEQQKFYDKRLALIRQGGDSTHSAFVVNSIQVTYDSNPVPVEPAAVGLCNDDDPVYVTYFNNWDEVNAFIDQIKKTAVEAWGEENPTKKIEDLDEDWDRDLVEEENFDPITGWVNLYMYVDGE